MTTTATHHEPDIYDEAIAYLTASPNRICQAWYVPMFSKSEDRQMQAAHCLFRYVSPTGEECTPDGPWLKKGSDCGCLTQIRRGKGVAVSGLNVIDRKLTNEIRADLAIPEHQSDITPAHLPVFAEWQRELDARFPGRRESWLRRIGAV